MTDAEESPQGFSNFPTAPKLLGFASICITSRSRSAKQISEFLSVEPTSSAEAGEHMSSKNEQSRLRDYTSWILQSTLPAGVPLEEHLVEIANFVDDKKEALSLLIDEGCVIDYSCVFFAERAQSDLLIKPDVMRKLCQISADFRLEFTD